MIKNILVIGAGTMGTGIAQVASSHGCIVTLIDSAPDAIERSKSYLDSVLNRLVEKGKPKKVALVAVMNKLIKQAFAIGTKLENYVEPKLNLEIKLN